MWVPVAALGNATTAVSRVVPILIGGGSSARHFLRNRTFLLRKPNSRLVLRYCGIRLNHSSGEDRHGPTHQRIGAANLRGRVLCGHRDLKRSPARQVNWGRERSAPGPLSKVGPGALHSCLVREDAPWAVGPGESGAPSHSDNARAREGVPGSIREPVAPKPDLRGRRQSDLAERPRGPTGAGVAHGEVVLPHGDRHPLAGHL